jgi:hypothetical protein
MTIKYDDKNGSIKRPNEMIQYDRVMISNFAQAAQDIFFFAEHFFYIVHPVSGSQLIQLRDYQKRMLMAFIDHRMNVVLSARQIGKTTIACIYFLWYAMFNKDKTLAILANKADTAKSILSDIKFAYENMPSYMKPGVLEYNVNSIVFDNGTKIFAKATSPDALRGEAISVLLSDEFSFVPANIADAFWTSNYPTLSTGGRAIIVSTPNGTGNLFYKLWKDALDKRNTFNPVKVDWHEVPGRDEAWKEETIKNIGKIKFAQEYGNQFAGSTVTLIDADVIVNKLKWSEPFMQPDDDTKLWKLPKEGHKYVICIDTGGGVGSDSSIMNVFDITEFPEEPAEQVAIWKNNKTPPNEFADVLKAACEYWNEAYTIGETNGLSAEVLSRLFNDYEYENIFMDMANGGTFGVFATRKSKPIAALNFKELLENGSIKLNDAETIDEIGIFEEVSPGVFKAKTGKNLHDDCVMTCLWLAYFLRSSYYEDEKSMWGNENGYSKQFSEDADADNEDANIDALQAFLEHDKMENGDDWLERDEWKDLRR